MLDLAMMFAMVQQPTFGCLVCNALLLIFSLFLLCFFCVGAMVVHEEDPEEVFQRQGEVQAYRWRQMKWKYGIQEANDEGLQHVVEVEDFFVGDGVRRKRGREGDQEGTMTRLPVIRPGLKHQ